MKPSSRSPSYIVRNPYSYCFRMNVPADLQRFVGKKELRYSLKTGYLGVAKEKARVLSGRIQLLFKLLRRGGVLLGCLTEERIQEIVQGYLKKIGTDLDTYYSSEPLSLSVVFRRKI
jgi:hypothetical protein